MIIKKEIILDEDDIKEAIKDYIEYEVDKDRVSIVLNAKLKTDDKCIAGYEIIAICKEDTGNA